MCEHCAMLQTFLFKEMLITNALKFFLLWLEILELV